MANIVSEMLKNHC